MFDRKRMKWTQNLKITNLGSFNGRLKHLERENVKSTKIKETM